MDTTNGALSNRDLDIEEWKDLVRPLCGRYNPEGIGPHAFTGAVTHQKASGLDAVVLSCTNTHRIERTQLDVRSDGMEHFYVLIPLAGR
jgi:AraC family transcriptional regulator, positive regulator of tynA and feaB